MSTKLISYESLRTVIFYLEPNLRILLSAQLPTIRLTEKTVPLILKNLELTSSTISAGETYYNLGLTRFDKHEDKWKFVSNFENGKINQEVDKYGFELAQGAAKQGDLVFGAQMIKDYTEEQVMSYLESNQDILVAKKEGFWDQVRYVCNSKQLADQFAYKKANSDSVPFMCLLHLTIHRLQNENDFHEFVVYNGNLSSALKYLNTRILGGRGAPIRVQNLEIHPSGCIRLPENWKVEVQHLKVKPTTSSCLEVIRPIMATFPLETITVFQLLAGDYPMLESARKVVVSPFHQDIAQMPLRRVHFDHDWRVRTERIIAIMEMLRDNHHPIGTYYSFGLPSDATIKIVDEFKSLPEVVVREEGVVKDQRNHYRYVGFPQELIFPINRASEISIRFIEAYSTGPNKYRIDMKVQPKGLAKTVTKNLVLTNIQLSDNSRKAIIANMEPCFRFFLSQKNPAFALLEKESPLKIEYLSITPSSIEIDWACYRCDVRPYDLEQGRYKESDVGRVRRFNTDNSPGRFEFGVDEGQDEEKELADLNAEYEMYAQKLKQFPERRDYCEEQMEWIQEELYRYRQRRENEEPQYKYFLRLSIENWIVKEEIIEYQENHHIAMKYLIEKLLGGRAETIQVKNLSLKANNKLLRLPKHLKMNVKNLTVEGNKNDLEILRPILSNLRSLESIGSDRLANDDFDILKSAKNIVLTKDPTEKVTEQLSYLLCHPQVSFNYYNSDHVMEIVAHWQHNAPEIGTEFTFARKDREKIETIARQPGAEIGFVSEKKFDYPTQCVIFPINNELEIIINNASRPRSVSETFYQYCNYHHTIQMENTFDWLVMKVCPKGLAVRF